jgi:hypothetical protein
MFLKRPSEVLELIILLHRQMYQTMKHHKSLLHHDSHPQFILITFIELLQHVIEKILKILHF